MKHTQRIYELDYTEVFLEDIETHKKNGKKSILEKIDILLSELRNHPTIGTGKPERLKGTLKGKWSRRITGKHRLIYQIDGKTITVLLLSAYGHYI